MGVRIAGLLRGEKFPQELARRAGYHRQHPRALILLKEVLAIQSDEVRRRTGPCPGEHVRILR